MKLKKIVIREITSWGPVIAHTPYRVDRGGCWYGSVISLSLERNSRNSRSYVDPIYRNRALGFRLVRLALALPLNEQKQSFTTRG
jgi:formylglycine-generating enzyme required for sulfatase activity